MQYQIFERETGKIIAWIDSESHKHVVLNKYNIKQGEALGYEETEDGMFVVAEEHPTLIKEVAQFELVSYEQWCEDNDRDPSFDLCVEEYNMLQCPVRKTRGSAGYDFLAPFDIVIKPHETVLLSTGVKCQIDEGYVLELYPRSSLGFKYNLTLDNTVGIIDADYYNNEDNEGHIKCKMTNHSDKEIVIRRGEGYMQGLFKQFFITKDDNATAKRVGGIGSTNS